MKRILVLMLAMLMGGLSVVPAAHAQHPYAGVGLGAFTLDPGGAGKTAFGGFLQLGDDFYPYLGGELRIGTTDKASNAQMNWFVSALAKPRFDVSADLTVYGLLGVTVMRTSYVSATTLLNQHASKADISYGLGADYWVGPQATVGAEWVRYANRADSATKNSSFKGLTVDGFVIDAKYHF